MDNVNDLKRTTRMTPQEAAAATPAQRTISLSAINNNKKDALKINTINPAESNNNAAQTADAQQQQRPVVRINPNLRKPMRRTITDPSQLDAITVNPEEIIPQPKKELEPSSEEKAFANLDRVIKERQEEYKAFMESAIEQDKHNRELIEAGIEEEPQEMNYLPDEIDKAREEEIEQHKEVKQKKIEKMKEDDPNFDQDLYDIENDLDEEMDKAEDDIQFEDAEVEETPVQNTIGDLPNEDDVFTQLSNLDENEIDNAEEEENHISDISYETESDPSEPDYVNEEEEKPVEDDIPVVTEATPEVKPATTTTAKEDSESYKKLKAADDLVKDTLNKRIINVSSTSIDNDSDASANFDIDEADIDDEQKTKIEEDDLTQEEIDDIYNKGLANLKTEILSKVIQAGKKLDVSTFTVSKSVISLNDAMRKAKKADTISPSGTNTKKAYAWPMLTANRPFWTTPLQGTDMALMYSDEINKPGDVVITQDQAKVIYEHDANPYKPSTLKAWAKTIPFYDIDSLFAAIYAATMTGANYVPKYCNNNKCQYAFLTENIPIDQMVNIEKPEIKEKFEKIKKMRPTPENSAAYESVVSIINDKYAVGIKAPSLYTILYELNSITDAFRDKYRSIINLIQFIDYIYVIDRDNGTLDPIGWKTYVGDDGKTYKSKIATYSKILRELDATEFSVLMSLVSSMQQEVIDNAVITYRIPEATCPKCGKKIPEDAIQARNLVFIRQRLVDMATMPSAR